MINVALDFISRSLEDHSHWIHVEDSRNNSTFSTLPNSRCQVADVAQYDEGNCCATPGNMAVFEISPAEEKIASDVDDVADGVDEEEGQNKVLHDSFGVIPSEDRGNDVLET